MNGLLRVVYQPMIKGQRGNNMANKEGTEGKKSKKEEGLKKVKFYDWLFIASVISLISIFVVVWFPPPFDNIVFLSLLISNISGLTFSFGILYWMFKNKNYILFAFGIFISLIPILYYFFSLRKELKKGVYIDF